MREDHITGEEQLRPLERVILRMRREGLSIPEIGAKVSKKPGTVERILAMTQYPRDGGGSRRRGEVLRPIERVVLRHRQRGASYGEIANRIGRSGSHVRRIEQYARLKLAEASAAD